MLLVIFAQFTISSPNLVTREQRNFFGYRRVGNSGVEKIGSESWRPSFATKDASLPIGRDLRPSFSRHPRGKRPAMVRWPLPIRMWTGALIPPVVSPRNLRLWAF